MDFSQFFVFVKAIRTIASRFLSLFNEKISNVGPRMSQGCLGVAERGEILLKTVQFPGFFTFFLGACLPQGNTKIDSLIWSEVISLQSSGLSPLRNPLLIRRVAGILDCIRITESIIGYGRHHTAHRSSVHLFISYPRPGMAISLVLPISRERNLILIIIEAIHIVIVIFVLETDNGIFYSVLCFLISKIQKKA